MSFRTPRINNIEAAQNIIINGNFDFWQRGTSFAAIPNGDYSTDRFEYVDNTAAIHTISRSADVPNKLSTYSMLATVTTLDSSIDAADINGILHRIEGNNIQLLANKTVTLSFYVKASKIGTYCVSFRNSAATRSYVAEYEIEVASTWERKEITVDLDVGTSSGVWDYGTGTGLSIFWALLNGSNNQGSANTWLNASATGTSNQVNALDAVSATFQLAQVMVHEGSTAGNFRRAGRNIMEELQLCQRYYEKSYNIDVAPTSNTFNGSASFAIPSSGFFRKSIEFAVTKRIAPTFVNYNPVTGTIGEARRDSGSAIGVGSPSPGTHGSTFQTGGGNPSGVEYRTQWTADAEL